jgi:hypothetical protein
MKIQQLIQEAAQKQYSYSGHVDIHMYLAKVKSLKRKSIKPLLEQLCSHGQKGMNYNWKMSYKGTHIPMSSHYSLISTIAHSIAEIACCVDDLEEVDVTLCEVDWRAGIGFPGKEKTIKLKL